MDQSELLALMAELADHDAALRPGEAAAFLAEYLERMVLTMDQADYEGMLYTGACIWMLHRDQR